MNDVINENKLIASLILITTLLLVRWLVVRYLRKRPFGDTELPKRLINTTNNAANLLIVVGLIIIWLSELRFLALSVATFIVALVIATREFIQCFLGSLYLASSRLFNVGDWIQVGDHCGEVVRSDWLSTTLLEVDIASSSYGYTGKTLVIPNNQLVANTVTNLNFMRRYVAHSFTLVREPEEIDLCEASDFVLEKAASYCDSFSEVAERYNSLIEKRLGITITGPDASVRVTTTDLGKNALTVTVFCPTHEAVDIEQKITRDFMTYWYQALHQSKSDSKSTTNNANTVVDNQIMNT